MFVPNASVRSPSVFPKSSPVRIRVLFPCFPIEIVFLPQGTPYRSINPRLRVFIANDCTTINSGPAISLDIHAEYVSKQWDKTSVLLNARSVWCGFTKHVWTSLILILKSWSNTHHTSGYAVIAVCQVSPRRCFYLILTPVIGLMHYLTFLPAPLEAQQTDRLCLASDLPCSYPALLVGRLQER